MLSVVAAALVGAGVAGCSHSSDGQTAPSTASTTVGQGGNTVSTSPTATQATAAIDGLLAAVQATVKSTGSNTLYEGSGAGSRVLDVADNDAKSFHITVACDGINAAFNSGQTKFFQTSHCSGQRAVYGADVPIRYLHAGEITIVAPSGTQWAVEITSP